jgi:hypothetical protein
MLDLTNGRGGASLEELLNGLPDFSAQTPVARWTADHSYAQRLRRLNRVPGASYATFRKGIEIPDPAICPT